MKLSDQHNSVIILILSLELIDRLDDFEGDEGFKKALKTRCLQLNEKLQAFVDQAHPLADGKEDADEALRLLCGNLTDCLEGNPIDVIGRAVVRKIANSHTQQMSSVHPEMIRESMALAIIEALETAGFEVPEGEFGCRDKNKGEDRCPVQCTFCYKHSVRNES